MNWEEVAEMRGAGISFGSHTVEHTLLSWAAPGDAARELARSQQDLEARLGAPAREISYPWGGMSPFTRQQAEAAGFDCAVTTRPGLVGAGTDPLRLPRIAISEAQLGGRQRRGQWDPAPLDLHLGRARRRRGPAAPARPARRLRVGFLVDNPEAWGDPPEGHLGGSELQLLRLMEALDAAYFQPELYFLRPPASGLPTNLPWPAYGTPSASRGRLATIARLRRLLRRHRPDVVQSLFVDGTFLGVPAAWLAGVPAVLCARRNAGYWKRWFHRAALRIINRMANAWQVNSPVIYQMLESEEGVSGEAVEIVPNWIDLDRFRPATPAERAAARAELGLDGSDFVAVCVANYSPVKDLTRLAMAAERLRDALPQLRILLVGDGPERERLEGAVAAGGTKAHVRLEGTSDAVGRYLAAADVGVLPSSSEGCSNAVLEYMAAGLPTVLSDIGANRALAGESFFPVGDAAGLARELQALAADPELRARRGAENRRRAEAYGGNAFRTLVQGHFLRVAARRDRAAGGELDRRKRRGLQ
jgi:glycosyltransferase involved in cell wall biosynthesis